MIIKYESIGDQVILNVPDSALWEIRYRLFDDEGLEDHNLYLTVEDREYMLRDTDYWCQGRSLPYTAVGALYEEMVRVIARRIAQEPGLRLLDIEEIESGLIESKYKQKWLERGYIEIDADGRW